MDTTREPFDAEYAEKVRLARSASPRQKLLAGPELFDRACLFMRGGIRSRFPRLSDQEVERVLQEQLQRTRAFEEAM